MNVQGNILDQSSPRTKEPWTGSTKLSAGYQVPRDIPSIFGVDAVLVGSATFGMVDRLTASTIYGSFVGWNHGWVPPNDLTNTFRMSNYRRYRVPGGTYFFTVNLLDRSRDLLVRHVDALREAVRITRQQRPFRIDAWVVLPDHLHCEWTLPPGDEDFSNRWKAIKIRFVQTIPLTERRSKVRTASGERGVWQRRFWEHAIRDDHDFARHIDYVHWNPVKRVED